MMQRIRSPRVRAATGAAALALAAAGFTWTALGQAGTNSDQSRPQVSVKVDDSPVTRQDAQGRALSYSPIVKQVTPSVVMVNTSGPARSVTEADLPPFLRDPRLREFFGIPEMPRQNPRPVPRGLGSGVIVSTDGYILTNNHVIAGASEIRVTLDDRRELTATVVGTDPESDLAVIKIDAQDLPALTFADSDKIEVGDFVLAVGNPFGIGQTVTSGMISGLGRASQFFDLDYQDFIQTDAAINPGNSGGALIDVQGRLVGVNTAILSRSGGFQGIGFAIPANLARNVMQQLVATGRVSRGYLGVGIQDLTAEIAQQFQLDAHRGALVSDVRPDSPAERAGLQSGDVITRFNNRRVTDARNLRLAVADVVPGTSATAEVLRNNEAVKLEITVGERPGELAAAGGSQLAPGGSQRTLQGVAVSDLNPRVRREFDVPSRVQGALITSVDPNSAAARAGLQPGDVIMEINRRAVRGADDAIRLTENGENRRTLVLVWNQRGTRYVVVDETQPAANPESTPPPRRR